ncbi:MAG: hypothetical protein FWH08_00365 [Oscillospiraceae bacterium]|nr:hypothetical protein [Oscillospiraceae bacterium]
MEKEKLYIPYGLKTDKEIFPGFGKKQLRQTVAGTLICAIIGGFIYGVTGALAILILLIITGIFGSVMFTIRDQYNVSVVDQIANLIKFSKSQQKFNYIYRQWDL